MFHFYGRICCLKSAKLANTTNRTAKEVSYLRDRCLYCHLVTDVYIVTYHKTVFYTLDL